MTFTALTRRFRGVSTSRDGPDEALIGAAADRTFACPGCTRPLAIGQGRCPGCGSFLVSGVLVRTAIFLMLVGSVVGMIGGAMIAGVAMGPRLTAGDAAVAALAAASLPPASTGPGATGDPEVSPAAAATADPVASPAAAPQQLEGVVAGPALPEGIAAAFLQVATVNDRLGRSASALADILAARAPASSDVAPLLRKMAADARSADAATRRLAGWPATAGFAGAAAALYASVVATAADGLAAPLADDAAYAKAGTRMLAALGDLPSLAAAARDAAAHAGVDLREATPVP